MKQACLLLAIVVANVAACGGATPRNPSPTPSRIGTTVAPSPTPTILSPTPIAVEPGEPWVAFGRYINHNDKAAFLMRPDGSDVHRIMADIDGDVRALAWSADGSRLAYVYQGPGAARDGEIWTSAADGSDSAKLLDGAPACSGAFYPAWSPDGTTLAFVCYTNGTTARLSLFDLASERVTDLVSLIYPEVFDNPPEWSPDGSTIAFDILHWDPTDTFLDGSLIATVPSQGGKVRRLTPFDAFFAFPSWRPDGQALAVNTYDQGNMVRTPNPSNAYELDLDGTVLRQVTTDSVDGSYRITQPSWDPSGDRIWVTLWRPGISFSSIHVGFVDPATGEVTDLGVEGSTPHVRPT